MKWRKSDRTRRHPTAHHAHRQGTNTPVYHDEGTGPCWHLVQHGHCLEAEHMQHNLVGLGPNHHDGLDHHHKKEKK